MASCQKKETQSINQNIENDSTEFLITRISDTLNSNGENIVVYDYSSKFKNFTINKDRFIKIYYVIQDSIYNGEIEEIINHNYDAFADMNTTDTLFLKTFNEKGDKFITFIVLDLIEKKEGDSVRFQYLETTYARKTFVK